MSLSETDTMSSRRTAKLIFYRDLLKSLFAKYTKIIIYDFDLAELGANKLRGNKFFVKFVSTKE
jgi:lipopolysaccharide biosynthesis glycosyltransferase